jgi:hypothetical protein
MASDAWKSSTETGLPRFARNDGYFFYLNGSYICF